MTPYAWIVLVAIAVCSGRFQASWGLHQGASDPSHKVVSALRKALEFFHREGCNVNLDGIFGLRAAEGQLQLILENNPNLRLVNPTLWRTIHVLSNTATESAKKSLPCLHKSSPKYLHKFQPIVDKPFKLHGTQRHVKTPVKVGEGDDTDEYDEHKGDKCYTDLMGTDGKPKCSFTKSCWKMMTSFKSPSFRNYVATHALIYFILIEHVGCKQEMAKFLGHSESYTNVQQRVCDHIFSEAKLISKNNHVDIGQEDIFLEQICLCGMVGFEDFVRADWLELILGMQNKEIGCFGYEKPIGGARKLLVERVLDDGCSSHTSGVGLASLGVYLRVLIEHDGKFPISHQ